MRRLELAERAWAIEGYHRSLKQCCKVERCQARSSRAQRNHIGMAIRAFARLAWHFCTTGVSWYASKAQTVREAIRAYRYKHLCKMPVSASLLWRHIDRAAPIIPGRPLPATKV